MGLVVEAQKKRNCPPELKEIRLGNEDEQAITDALDQLADGSTVNRVLVAYGKAFGALEALVGDEAEKTNIWNYT